MLEPEEIQRMSVMDRLKTLEIRQTLQPEESALPSPEWHEQVLRERKRRAESGESKFLTLDDLRNRLRNKA